MKLTIDGRVYQWQRYGGVSRIYAELIPRICDLEPALSVSFFTERPLAQQLPQHPQITHRAIPTAARLLRIPRPWQNYRRYAQRLIRRSYTGNGKGAIWQSTYFTEPDGWKGKRVVMLYDALYERCRDLFAEPGDEVQRQQIRRCLQTADLVIAISEATSRDAQEFYGIPAAKIRTIPLAHSNGFRRLDGMEARGVARLGCRPFLLFVGDRNHYKNFRTLLEAYARWRNRKEVDLIVVGAPDWSPQEIAQLDRLALSEKVRLLGHVSDERLVELYNGALAFVYPSLYEGFGIPLLEAMACGCLVVASRIPSTVEVAAEYPIYFEALQPDTLISALDGALTVDNMSRTTRGMEHVRKYSWEGSARKTLTVYQELDVA